MFLLLDIRGTGLGAENFARALLEHEGVATFPCDSFGPSGAGHNVLIWMNACAILNLTY
jgi:arginine:pyruvate transaminase